MRIMIAGAHGKVGLRLGRRLAGRGDDVTGIVRDPGQRGDLTDASMRPAVLDLEREPADAVAAALAGADAVVFSAGAGPGSGVARKDAVDRAASVLLADAAQRAGVRRFLQVSSMGVEGVAGGEAPDGMGEVFAAYLRAKLAAEEDLRGRDLDWTILRPGSLTDDPGKGQVRLAPRVPRGRVSRDDVAAVLVALLDAPSTTGLVLELVAGSTPVDAAVRSLTEADEHPR